MFQNLNPKRIIAREGLIILSLIFLSALAMFIDSRLRSHKRLYEARVMEISPVGMADEWIKAEDWSDDKDERQKLSVREGTILRFPKNTNSDVIKQTIRRDFPNIKSKGDDWIIWDSSKGENIKASYNEKGKPVFDGIIYKIEWSYVSFFFLIFAYPLYLIIRFVAWAIGTLKKT